MEARVQVVEDSAGRLVLDRFLRFLRTFESTQDDPGDEDGQPAERPRVREYVKQVDHMKDLDMTTMFVDFMHVLNFDAPLASSIRDYYVRFEPFLRAAVTQLVRENAPDFATLDGEERLFFISFAHTGQVVKVRDLRMSLLGTLTSFRGTVTRTSEVRPELLYGRFQCTKCRARSPMIEQQFKYTEPASCATSQCGNRNKWELLLDQSRFTDWQRVRVQENADEIPPGSMPRSIDVILRHAAVDRAKAGDRVVFTGTLIVVPDVMQMYKAGQVTQSGARARSGGNGGGGPGEGVSGMRALGVRDLSYRTCFLAQSVASVIDPRDIAGSTDTDYDKEAAKTFTDADRREFHAMADSGQVYLDLVRSLVPTIHGHTEIKKGMLMQLCGGVQKYTAEEAIRLRGDINVCIVGDPSTAKSQFLKYVYRFWPRSVYTSGKSASAAGLTASVVKDPDTGEFAIEAGALMLADHGVCCLPESDHQLLTNRGFMTLPEIEAAWGGPANRPPTSDLLLAGYDASSRALQFEQPRRLIVNAAHPGQHLVRLHSARHDVDLAVTPNHDLYIQRCGLTAFEKMQARDVAGADAEAFRVLASAAAGCTSNASTATQHVDEDAWRTVGERTWHAYQRSSVSGGDAGALWLFDGENRLAAAPLHAVHATAALDGMRRVAGARWNTSSTVLELSTRVESLGDLVVVLASQAGMSAVLASDAASEHWTVRVSRACTNTQPLMRPDTDVNCYRYEGRTWCVSMPSTFIVARRRVHANNGVAASRPLIIGNCIDEFDKMDNSDQVAIHEAMEQQTISVTKAGLQATLNARASILAAANPVFGRYDKTKSLRQNVNISAPIMSRFDLFFIVLDEVDELRDEMIARHILGVHQKRAAALADVVYPMERVLDYIKYARTLSPQLNVESKRAIIRAYQRLRASDSTTAAGSSSYRVTVRQLESLIRLSEALARIHLDPVVRERYVLEAFALIRKSMLRADAADIHIGDEDMDDPADALLSDALAEAEAAAAARAALAAATAPASALGRLTPPEDPQAVASNSPGVHAVPQDDAAGQAAPAEHDPAGALASSADVPQKKPKKTVKISSDKYEHIKRSLAIRLREQERRDAGSDDAEAGGDRDGFQNALKGAVTEGDLIAWYLEQSIESIPDEAALLAEQKLLQRVIRRLIESDDVLYYAIPAQGTDPTVDPAARWIRLNADYVLPGFDDAAAE